MRKFLLVLLLLSLPACAWNPGPGPGPGPEPTPTPPPPPPPPPETCADRTPDGKRCCNQPPDYVTEECWNLPPGGEWSWIPKTPEPPPPPPCTPTPQARIYVLWNTQRATTYDATPAICRCPELTPPCYEGRYCHPVACEGDPDRLQKERELMGGDKPIWTLKVYSGNLRLIPDPWKGVVAGRGTGQIWWCFENGNACSKKLRVER
jgi:hypothetical protein